MPATAEELRQEAARKSQQANYREVNYFREKPGVNRIRILPAFGPRKFAYVEIEKVFGVGPNGKHIVPRAQFNLPCPLEDYKKKLMEKGDEASKKELDSLGSKTRNIFILLDRSNEIAGPLVWETNNQNAARIMALSTDAECGEVWDAEQGRDLKITYTPSGQSGKPFPSWIIDPCMERSPLITEKEKWDEWLSKDYFIEFRIEEPNDAEWITAVLAGTEGSFKRDNQQATGGDHVGPNQLPAADVAQPAIPGATPTPTPVTSVPGVLPAKYPYQPDTQFWVLENSTPVQRCAEDVWQFLVRGNDVQCCPVSDSNDGWKKASDRGFTVPPPAPPSNPPAPPVAPAVPTATPATPPPVNQVTEDLRAQLAGAK